MSPRLDSRWGGSFPFPGREFHPLEAPGLAWSTETARQMSASDPKVPIVLFTILEIQGLERPAEEAGIRAIVPKNEAWNLIGSIESIVTQKSIERWK